MVNRENIFLYIFMKIINLIMNIFSLLKRWNLKDILQIKILESYRKHNTWYS